MIAYLRDLGFEYHFLAESFETAVAWPEVRTLSTHAASLTAECSIMRKSHAIVSSEAVSMGRASVLAATTAALRRIA